jgi:hypothetical protein
LDMPSENSMKCGDCHFHVILRIRVSNLWTSSLSLRYRHLLRFVHWTSFTQVRRMRCQSKVAVRFAGSQRESENWDLLKMLFERWSGLGSFGSLVRSLHSKKRLVIFTSFLPTKFCYFQFPDSTNCFVKFAY